MEIDQELESKDSILKERYDMASQRISQIPKENIIEDCYQQYFRKVSEFMLDIMAFYQQKEFLLKDSLEVQKQWNHRLYEDILPENYGQSYGNPAYACQMLGQEYGQLLSFLYSEIRGMICYAFEDRLWDMTVICELFLEIYQDFVQEKKPEPSAIKEILYWYVSDYADEMVEERTRQMLDPQGDFAAHIIETADLTDLRYLYAFGEYISDNELQMAEFLNKLPEEEIYQMAKTYTEGYRMGFVNAGKDLSKKKVVNIRYNLGFERMIRTAIEQFQTMGLKPVIYRYATHVVSKRQHIRIGYTGAVPNKQYDYDHRGDAALFIDEDFVKRKLRLLQNAYEKYKDLAAVHGGPAVVEIFGETPFVPENVPEALTLTSRQQKLQVSMDNQSSQITNRYIKGDERSFTIIAYPIPEIGPKFQEIFRDTVKINTLDYKKYEQIQQTIIGALDQGTQVHVKGSGNNKTDLYVQLHSLENPEKETIFENCVADVNIPVGEVFTSPKLAGTTGVLHVSGVYLNELYYKELSLTFQDGKIEQYSCENFAEEKDNHKYIQENILFHHPTLPMGEFAIGTNTTAYVVARKYGIQDKMPILIAEKMGPHFAVGDTCYSWEEDTPVYNPDGKEIIARDNEVSRLRKTDVNKAYFGCHTDITIPYEELEYIHVITADNRQISIIENGRFVLPGTESLNEPLKEEQS